MLVNKQKHYTVSEVAGILADKESGYSWGHLKTKYGRTVSGLRQIIYAHQQFNKGHKTPASLSRIFTALTGTQSTAMIPSEPSLEKLDKLFQLFQAGLAEVIDEEVNRRSNEIFVELAETKKELATLKEAAQQSSVVGVLRRKWGLTA